MVKKNALVVVLAVVLGVFCPQAGAQEGAQGWGSYVNNHRKMVLTVAGVTSLGLFTWYQWRQKGSNGGELQSSVQDHHNNGSMLQRLKKVWGFDCKNCALRSNVPAQNLLVQALLKDDYEYAAERLPTIVNSWSKNIDEIPVLKEKNFEVIPCDANNRDDVERVIKNVAIQIKIAYNAIPKNLLSWLKPRLGPLSPYDAHSDLEKIINNDAAGLPLKQQVISLRSMVTMFGDKKTVINKWTK